MQPKEEEFSSAIKPAVKVKDVSPAEQWDAVAFKLIKDELAPKGYSEIKRGPWRGKVQSNIPFLPKQSVERCQKISAQIVRTFRAKAEKALKEQMEFCDTQSQKYYQELSECHFWEWRKKRELRRVANSLFNTSVGYRGAINQISNINIK